MNIYNQFNDFIDNLISYDKNTNEIKVLFNNDGISNVVGNIFRIAQIKTLGIESVKEYSITTTNRHLFIESNSNTINGFTTEVLLKIKKSAQDSMAFLASGWEVPDWRMSDLGQESDILKTLTHLTDDSNNLEVYVKSFIEYDMNNSNYELLEFHRIIQSIASKKGLYLSEFKKDNKIELRPEYDVFNEESDKNLYITGEKNNIIDLIETIRCQMLPQQPKTLLETCTKFVFNNKSSFQDRFFEIPQELVEKIDAYPNRESRLNIFLEKNI